MKILEISSFSLDSRKLLALTFLELSAQTVFLRLRFLMARLENAALTGAVVCKARWGAKGKIPKGNIQQPRRPEDRCYDSKRWLTLACSLPAWSSRPGVGGLGGYSSAGGGYSSAGAGQSHQSDIRQQWRLFFVLLDSSHHLCSLKLMTDLCEVTVKKHWE